jgi:hypothetical protein
MVSIVARFFTKMLCFAMRFAMIVRDKATQTGKPLKTLSTDDTDTTNKHYLRYEGSQTTNGVDYGTEGDWEATTKVSLAWDY